MITSLSAWVVALPLGAILGWIGNRLFAPTLDALGVALLDKLSMLTNRKRIASAAYEDLERQIKQNHSTNRHARFNERKTYLHDREIATLLANHGSFMRHAIKNAWIEQAVINNYDQSDVFFAGMELLKKQLGKADIQKIYERFRDNDQAALWPFLEVVEQRNPKLLSPNVLLYLREQQEEYDKLRSEEQPLKQLNSAYPKI